MFCLKKSRIVAYLIGFILVQNAWAQDAEEEKIQDSQRPLPWLNADFSVDNSVGIGTFVSGYGRMPSWSTSFSISPSAQLPIPDPIPKLVVGADFSASVWWLNSLANYSNDVRHRVQFPDIGFSLSAPSLYKWSGAGLTFSGSIPLTVATSSASLAMNRVIGTGIGAGVKWKGGPFGISLSPSVRTWIYKGESKTINCSDSEFIFREEDLAGGGHCFLSGRQNLLTVKTGLSGSYKYDAHRIAVGLTYYWNYLRPLEYRPELSSVYSSSQSWTQSMMGRVAYSFDLPLPVDSSLTAGIMSHQSVFSKTGQFQFPFFDYSTPNKNQTQVFLEMSASL